MNPIAVEHPLDAPFVSPQVALTPPARLGLSPRRLAAGAFQFVLHLVEDRFPNWAHVRHQAKWEKKWANPEYQPFWRTEQPQKEFVEAIGDGWLPKNTWIYDIGCGAGETSRWLSEQGLHILGFDFSAAAIAICRRLVDPTADKVRFAVVDICAEEMPLPPTGAVVDRGCFHQIKAKFRPTYVRNAARLTAPGGHFLLLAATYQRDGYRNNRHACTEDKLADEVKQLFRQYFRVERIEPAVINTADDGAGMPAVAFWMVREEGEVTSESAEVAA